MGRFAAHVVLCGSFSGIMTTCLMLGLRIVPVYTRTVHNLRNGERCRFSSLLAKQDSLYPCKRVLDWLPALNMEDVAALARRINDAAFWERCEKMLPALQRHVTGRFRLERASRYTAGLIEHIILKGSRLAVALKRQNCVSEKSPQNFRG